jgi:ABC-2 type transport system permease protein
MKISILSNIQYRASGMIWMIGSVLEPLIYLVVWSTVAESKGGVVGGFTANQFAAYYIILMMVNHLTFSWVMQVFQFRIQYGALAHELLRPVHPIHGDIADNIAFKIVQMTVMLPALIFLTWYFEPDFNLEPRTLLIAIPVIILAFFVRFILEWTLALAAFWTTRIIAINNAYFAILMFLSGRIAPIALLPVWLQGIAEIMPFYYVIAFPVEIMMGTLNNQQIVGGVTTLLTWLILALIILRFAWSRAARNFSAVGS